MLHGSTIAISGNRDVSEADTAIIEMGMADLFAYPRTEIRFGGARGTDTIALAAACAFNPSCALLRVVLPSTLHDQPREARETILRCANDLDEMHLSPRDPRSYHARNLRLIEGASGLLAFWNGDSGGTAYTINAARKQGLPTEIVQLVGQPTSEAFGALTSTNRLSCPLLVWRPYVSERHGDSDPLSNFVRRQKAGFTSVEEIAEWTGLLVDEIRQHPLCPDAIVPVPRRAPGRANDLAPLVAMMARALGVCDGTGLLVRQAEPEGGSVQYFRTRFSPEEHERTLIVNHNHPAARSKALLLVDNVVTTGGSLEGACRRLHREFPQSGLTALAILGAGEFRPRSLR